MKFACVFPGQGSQSIGMMAELAEAYPIVTELFSSASSVLGYDLWDVVQNGPVEKLNSTEVTQPAMLTAGVAVYEILKQKFKKAPEVMAGHSLGEYTALVCAGALNFEDAVKLVAERGSLMQAAVPEGVGAMAAILGLEDSVIKEICELCSDDNYAVQAVNFNSPGQVVVAGNIQAVETAMAVAKDRGAKRAVKLPVSVPSHSNLMTGAAKQLTARLKEVKIKKASTIPVIQNVTAKNYIKPADVKKNLAKQLHNPVLWVDCINVLIAEGVDTILECGPGKVLIGLNKRINKDVTHFTINNIETLDSALERVGKKKK
ncbi:Malonyl CoA-acyl carrier protein transacylase [hydrothermal vent metagenome]|uniref:[acyl-carrier-protein] S-malonyltransferase n=1 Tax=hydrothermal vent metagenome TaxID=652676 RepID=A0A3B0WEB1_9ZZZZ